MNRCELCKLRAAPNSWPTSCSRREADADDRAGTLAAAVSPSATLASRTVTHAWANAAATPATTTGPSWALSRTGPHSGNRAIVHVPQLMQSRYIR